ncbi:MAG: PVC-type heme-binding CxxCH protein [Planctomycetota bacterium]
MMIRYPLAVIAGLAIALLTYPAAAQDRYTLNEGETVGVMGNAFAEHLSRSGYFEALVHAAHPDARIKVRSVPWSGDEVGLPWVWNQQPGPDTAMRIRERRVPTAEDRFNEYGVDVVFMFFGMSESFSGEAGLEAFERKLIAQIENYLNEQRFNGESAPRLVLVSPIAHEDLGAPLTTGAEVAARNAELAAYTDVMRRVAEAKGVRFVDLFEPSQALYAEQDAALTSNGIHPNELGCFYFAKEIGGQLGWGVDAGLFGGGDDTDQAGAALRTLAYDKFYHERLIYAATNTEYVWGSRREPFGSVNFPEEEAQLNRMVAARQQAMWEMPKPTPARLFAAVPTGKAVWEQTPTSRDFPEDEWTPTPVELIDRGGSIGGEILPPDQFAESFTMAEGYVAECFASEQDFPDLANPIAMNFDDHGRLWVMVTPTYPHVLPGNRPDCKILILADTDGDHKADKLTIFARYLDIPTGFAIDGDGAVYVGQAPYLFKLTDTDGDDVADRKETVFTGFGMPDSHHTLSAFTWDPGGGLLLHEGVFLRTNVETPRGTQRTRDAATWRFDPRTLELNAIAHCYQPNPWGHTFDAYGHSILMDTSIPSQFNFAHLMSPFVYPHKPDRPDPVISRGRPTAGSEIIYSRHFPDDVQGTYLYNNVIGFNGTFWNRLDFDGEANSGYTSQRMPVDLMQSSDANYRPVACEIAPDGSLYIIDWCNPLIGHMQFSIRDPRRDSSHGRVWRVRHAERPLVDAPDVAGASHEELLEILRTYEQNARDRARRRLQRADPGVVLPMLDAWLADLDEDDEDYARLMLEGLWIHQAHGSVNVDLLEEVLDLDNAAAVASGVRVLRYWLQFGHIAQRDADRRIRRLTDHDDMRVRIELAMACAYLADRDDAFDYLDEITELPMDQGLQNAVQQSIKYLNERPEPAGDNPVGDSRQRRYELEQMPPDALEREDLAEPMVAQVVLERDDVHFTFAGKR